MKRKLYIVTGAPGAGKSTTVRAFIALPSEYLAFDIDWLASTASALAGKSIYFEPSTWKPYGELWYEVLHAIYLNGKTPIFFAPTDPNDVATAGLPSWCSGVEWLLLDCDDKVRLNRLTQRTDWSEERIAEAMDDAVALRGMVDRKIDTANLMPEEVAKHILDWMHHAT